jgi:predicted flap endonuclease-1-like 5' DNA nuclease
MQFERTTVMSTPDIPSKAGRWKKSQASAPLKNDSAMPGEQNQTTAPTIFSFRRRDDLLSIEGIDPTTEMALNSIGVQQYSDFRRYSPEKLAQTLLERTGIAVSADTIASQDWIGWAEILAAENPSGGAAETDGSQTAVEMVDTAHHQIEPSSTVKEDDELALRIQEAQFTQVAMPAAKLLRGEINCVLAGGTAPTAAAYVALCAQVYVINKITGEPKLMASRLARLQPGEVNYFLLLEFEIPEIGIYQLQVVAFLLQPVAKVAFHQGPPLRVIA